MPDVITAPGLTSLNVSHRDLEEGVSTLAVEGEVDLASAPALKSAMSARLGAGNTALVLELSGVTHMDSTGLSVLVGIHRRLPAGGRIAIAGAQANVRALFELTGLDRTFKLCGSVEEALDWVRGANAPRLSLSADAALVVGLASTAIPFADSRAEEAERWLRMLRLQGDAGHALSGLGFGETPLVEIASDDDEPSERAHEDEPRDAVSCVTELAARAAAEHGAPTIGTAELLLGVIAAYGADFDRVLRAHGVEPAELAEQLRGAVASATHRA
jgi:anti-sigma B factor antagonist